MPDFAFEARCAGIVCGVDEAGRGPLAGPVVAAAVMLDRRRLPRALRDGLDNSKQLTPAAREEYAALLRRVAPAIGVGAASVAEIDRHNILRATLMAMCRAVAALGIVPAIALVDGNVAPPLPCAVETVIGGDGLSLSIAAASVIAKVTRDRADAPPRAALRRLWLGPQCRLWHRGASRRAACSRPDPAPSAQLRAVAARLSRSIAAARSKALTPQNY